MKAMKSVAEFNQAPVPGRYPSRIIGAMSENSKKSGATMLHLTLEVLAPAQYAGAQADDYLITDGTAKGAGMAKQKLRALGVNVETDEDIPDAVLAQQLLGLQLEVEYGNEARQTRSREDGPYDTDMTVIDARTGQTVTLQKLTVKNYFRHAVQAVQQAPQQFQQAPQQFAPQGQQAQAPVQGFAPGQMNPAGFVQPQYIPSVQQFAPQAPTGFAPQGPQFAQQQFAPQAQQGFAPQGGQAIPPWALGQGNGAPVAAPTESAPTGKRGKKGLTIQDQ